MVSPVGMFRRVDIYVHRLPLNLGDATRFSDIPVDINVHPTNATSVVNGP